MNKTRIVGRRDLSSQKFPEAFLGPQSCSILEWPFSLRNSGRCMTLIHYLLPLWRKRMNGSVPPVPLCPH